MRGSEKRRFEIEWKQFRATSLIPPRSCRTIDELRTCVALLCRKIEEYRVQSGYVPAPAYTLLAQYNEQQNRLLNATFLSTYGSL